MALGHAMRHRLALLVVLNLSLVAWPQSLTIAQEAPPAANEAAPAEPDAASGGTEEQAAEAAIPDKVDVAPVAEDGEIAARLERILDATKWFTNPSVSV